MPLYVIERAFARECEDDAWCSTDRIDQILEPFLVDQTPGGETKRNVVGNSEFRPASRSHSHAGPESDRIDSVGNRFDPLGRGSQCNRTPGEIVAA